MKVKITRGRGWYSNEVGNIFEIGSIEKNKAIEGICFLLLDDSDYFIRSENCVLEEDLPRNTPVHVGDIVYIDNCEECPDVNQKFGVVKPSEDYPGFVVDIPSRVYRDYTYISPQSDTWRVVQRDGILQSESKVTSQILADNINHPNHYKNSKFETIELIEEVVKHYDDGFVSYCIGNALKYLSRAPFKHEEPLEDTKKAAKYLEFAINYLETNNK